MRNSKLLKSIALFSVLTLLGHLPSKGVVAHAEQNININDTSEADVRNYYDSLNNKNESERMGVNLLLNLKPILKNGHKTSNYAGIWNWSKITDRDWGLSPMTTAELTNYNFNDNPYVHLLYRNDNSSTTAARADDTHGSIIDREHVWPKSLGDFGESAPAGTDVHHLMLADSKNNQSGHSNYDYGNVNPNSYTPIGTQSEHNNTGKRGTITFGGKSGTVYEPQDDDKGDIARAMFYMAARYSSYTSQSDPYLALVDAFGAGAITSSKSTPGTVGILSTLLEWHTLDPVSDYEIHRNNLIYNNFQYNRNPFIDYPSWVDAVWKNGLAASPSSDEVSQVGQSAIAPTSMSLNPNMLALEAGQTKQVVLSVSPQNANNSVTWSSSNDVVATVNGGTITGLVAGTTTITATSTLDADIKATAAITVSDVPIKVLDHISLAGVTNNLVYGADYPLDTLKVTAHYADNSTSDVTASALISKPDPKKLGTSEYRVDYTENGINRSAYYEVKVTSNGVNIGTVATFTNDLLISEYIEGSSNNKYLEIYNGTGASVDLSNYQLLLYSNGSTTQTNTNALSGTLDHKATKVYKNSSADLTLPNGVIAENATVLNFNGDDAIGLYNSTIKKYVDIFGVIGEDPGTAWTGNDVSTVDKTLVRKPNILAGVSTNPSSFDPSEEWIQYNKDDVSHLGSHDINLTKMGISADEQAAAYATYFLGITAIYCEDLEGANLAGAVWNELGIEYSYLHYDTKVIYKNSDFDPYDEVGVSGTVARYAFLINKYSALAANNFMVDEINNPIYSPRPNPTIPDQNNGYFILLFIGASLLFSVTIYYSYKKKH